MQLAATGTYHLQEPQGQKSCSAHEEKVHPHEFKNGLHTAHAEGAGCLCGAVRLRRDVQTQLRI